MFSALFKKIYEPKELNISINNEADVVITLFTTENYILPFNQRNQQ